MPRRPLLALMPSEFDSLGFFSAPTEGAGLGDGLVEALTHWPSTARGNTLLVIEVTADSRYACDVC